MLAQYRQQKAHIEVDLDKLHAKMAAERAEHLSEAQALRRELEEARAQTREKAGTVLIV